MTEPPSDGTQAATPDQNKRSAQISALPPVHPTAAGDRYELQAAIAAGGMGAVHRAWDNTLKRDVAVKVMHPGYATSEQARRRFEYEAHVTAQLQHPNVPPVYDLGTLADGSPFLAMKLIKGDTLDALLKARPDPAHDRGRFVGVFEAVCQAVGYAHSKGVLHRDLKPLNVMVGAFGEVQVMDWGLAKFRGDMPDPTAEATAASTFFDPRSADGSKTSAGSILGTPAYMPPEQAIGATDTVTERSDVFGLGAVLCTILTGKPPFVAASAEAARQLAAQAKFDDAFARLENCGAGPELVALAKRCLAADPTDRPANGSVVADEVAKLRADAEARARSAEVATATANARRRVLVRAAAAVVLTLTAGVAAAAWQAVRATDAQAVAQRRFALAADVLNQIVTDADDELANRSIPAPVRFEVLKPLGPQLERLATQEGVEDANVRRLQVLHLSKLGGLKLDMKDLDGAKADFDLGLRLAERLAADYPTEARHLFNTSVMRERVGRWLERTGRPAEALHAYQETLEVRKKAVALDPAKVDHRLGLIAVHNWISLTHIQLNDPAAALEAVTAAEAELEPLRDKWDNPGVLRQRAVVLDRYSFVHRNTGKFRDQLAALTDALAIHRQRAAADPGFPVYQSDIAGTCRRAAEAAASLNNPAAGFAFRDQERAALFEFQRLMRPYFAAIDRRAEIAASYLETAKWHGQRLDFVKAVRAGEAAVALRRTLAAEAPDDRAAARDEFVATALLAGNLAKLALLEKASKGEAAKYFHQAAATFREKLATPQTAAEGREDVEWCDHLAIVALTLGEKPAGLEWAKACRDRAKAVADPPLPAARVQYFEKRVQQLEQELKPAEKQ